MQTRHLRRNKFCPEKSSFVDRENAIQSETDRLGFQRCHGCGLSYPLSGLSPTIGGYVLCSRCLQSRTRFYAQSKAHSSLHPRNRLQNPNPSKGESTVTVEQIVEEVKAGRLDANLVLGDEKCEVCGQMVPASTMSTLTYDGREACETCWRLHENALLQCERDTEARIRAEGTNGTNRQN